MWCHTRQLTADRQKLLRSNSLVVKYADILSKRQCRQRLLAKLSYIATQSNNCEPQFSLTAWLKTAWRLWTSAGNPWGAFEGNDLCRRTNIAAVRTSPTASRTQSRNVTTRGSSSSCQEEEARRDKRIRECVLDPTLQIRSKIQRTNGTRLWSILYLSSIEKNIYAL